MIDLPMFSNWPFLDSNNQIVFCDFMNEQNLYYHCYVLIMCSGQCFLLVWISNFKFLC